MKDKVQLQSAAEFALNWPVSDVPEKTLVYVAHLLLDTIGVAAAAHDTDAGRIARDTAFLLYNTQSETHRASILFDGRTASLPGAAFAAASQIDNLDAHDGYNPVKGHIAVAVVPSLLSLAAQLPNLSGREALAALAISYEIAGRAGLALHDTVSDYHTSGAWNSLGVAALAARLRGASEDTLRQALGIAEYHGPRSQMMREINNPTMLHDGSGMGAFIGLSALLMAEQGFTGAPAITVEDDQVAHYWEDLGSHWLTDEQYVKPYPICRWAHAAIDGAEKIRQVHGISGSDVASIRIGAFQNATELFAGMPTTTSQAQYSLPFAVAAMLERGEVGVKEITGEALTDPALARLVDLTELHFVERHEARFPDGRWSDVEITTNDGRVLSSGDMSAKGGPDAPFTPAQITEKFERFAGPVLGKERTAAIRTAALGLVGPDCLFSSLTRLLSDPV